ncbi:hypothetical protein NDU88_004662, partial [Pleurodeles waltl]
RVGKRTETDVRARGRCHVALYPHVREGTRVNSELWCSLLAKENLSGSPHLVRVER